VNKVLILGVTILTLAGLLLGGYACAPSAQPAPTPGPTPASPTTKTLNFGIATPLTGGAAHIGEALKNGALMAVEDQNAQGGITIGGQNYTIEAIIRDSKFDVVVGKSVAEELIFDKNAIGITGSFVGDAFGLQSVSEPNKVIVFFASASNPAMTGPNKPYTFFYASIAQMINIGAAYIQKFHPEAKTVVSMAPAIPDTVKFLDFTKQFCEYYGLNWLGSEQYPTTTTDFSPMITRALEKNPDVIDTASTGGAMGGLCAQLVKQLRERGYNGYIWIPALPPPGSITEIVPEQYRTKIVINETDWEAPIVSDAYRDLCRRYVAKYNSTPFDISGLEYNVVKAFFEFLNTQDSMDSTKWMEGFAKYRWNNIWGTEGYWFGKPFMGIDRETLRSQWASEYINGKLQTLWTAPLPMQFFVSE
jgi:branched-chain amino acid transport system substrate-binding protein